MKGRTGERKEKIDAKKREGKEKIHHKA